MLFIYNPVTPARGGSRRQTCGGVPQKPECLQLCLFSQVQPLDSAGVLFLFAYLLINYLDKVALCCPSVPQTPNLNFFSLSDEELRLYWTTPCPTWANLRRFWLFSFFVRSCIPPSLLPSFFGRLCTSKRRFVSFHVYKCFVCMCLCAPLFVSGDHGSQTIAPWNWSRSQNRTRIFLCKSRKCS